MTVVIHSLMKFKVERSSGKMKVMITYKSRYLKENQTKEYNAIKVSSDSHFVNITTEDDTYAYPHTHIVAMRITEENPLTSL